MTTGHEHEIIPPNFSAGEPVTDDHGNENSKTKYLVGGGILLIVIIVATYLIGAPLEEKKPLPSPTAPPPAIKSALPPAPIRQTPPPPIAVTSKVMPPNPPLVAKKQRQTPVDATPTVNIGESTAHIEAPQAPAPHATKKVMMPAAPRHASARREKPRHSVYFLQLGAFRQPQHATRLCKTIKPVGFSCYFGTVQVKGTRFYRLRIGPFDSTKKIQDAANKFKHNGFSSRIIKLPADQVRPSITLPGVTPNESDRTG